MLRALHTPSLHADCEVFSLASNQIAAKAGNHVASNKHQRVSTGVENNARRLDSLICQTPGQVSGIVFLYSVEKSSVKSRILTCCVQNTPKFSVFLTHVVQSET